MKLLSLVVFALVLVAAFAQGERDCSTKCQCSNVPNKTEFCGILGNKRRTFGSSCEMLCYNCQNKSSEYFSRFNLKSGDLKINSRERHFHSCVNGCILDLIAVLSDYKYQSSGKCPADAAAGAAQGAQGANSQKVQPAERSTSTTSTTTPQPSSSQKPKN
ncbi:Hypothetical predicted protein [Cloeon dipterum]|uniref:Kazal-like domain-containing protein n=1 Tax=Cloeon dipterum TaxID=197152 RepID=A0A8S1DUH1_9INSE|nr:Hypothetical predicted protein [Cloeon dipterum]